jgi:transposase
VEGRVEFHLDVREDALRCPRCASTEHWRRGCRYRRVAGMPIGPKPVVLVVEVPRCECRSCGDTFEVSPPLPRPMPTTPQGWLATPAD